MHLLEQWTGLWTVPINRRCAHTVVFPFRYRAVRTAAVASVNYGKSLFSLLHKDWVSSFRGELRVHLLHFQVICLMLLNAKRQKRFNEKTSKRRKRWPLSPSQWFDIDSLEVKGRVEPQGFFGQINGDFKAKCWWSNARVPSDQSAPVFCLHYLLLFPLLVILANVEYLHIKCGLYPLTHFFSSPPRFFVPLLAECLCQAFPHGSFHSGSAGFPWLHIWM